MKKENILVDVKGSPYEMGYQHGEKLKDQIAKAVEVNLETLIRSIRNKAVSNITSEFLKTYTKRYVPYVEEYSGDLIEEIRGIADGSGRDFHEIFFLNCFLDHHDFTYPLASQRLTFGCTTFAAREEATAGHDTFIGQTYDISTVFEPQVVILRGQPEGKPGFVATTMAGIVAWNGVNDSGIGCVINRLTPNDGRPGVPYPVIVRRLLEQKTISKAMECVLRARRASGLNYVIGDRDGNLIGLETSATDYEYAEPEKDLLYHTNHYAAPSMREFSGFHRAFASESIIRQLRVGRLLEKGYGKIDMEYLKEITRDHNNYPLAICRHPAKGDEIMDSANTAAAFIVNLTKGKIEAVTGNPCEQEYQLVTFLKEED